MKITALEIAASSDMSLACVPLGEENDIPLDEDERQTFRSFPDLEFEVDEKALPLQVFLMLGSSKRLVIHPASGGKITMPTEEMELKADGRELRIFSETLFG